MNFIIFGLQPWDIEIGSNCKDIAMELARQNHNVLYVNAPLTRNHYLLKRKDKKVRKRIKYLKGKHLALKYVTNNLWTYYPDCIVESANFIRPHFLFKLVNRHNNRILAKSILRAIDELKFDKYFFFNDNSIYLGYKLKELLRPVKYIYYIRDNLTKMPFWKYHGSRMESDLISRSDLIVTNSDYYKEYALEYNLNSYMIGQGCDYTLLDNHYATEDLSKIKGTRIGYIGFLTTKRLSIDLIYSLATRKPEWNIILIGPEDDEFRQSSLHKLPNVYFLGPKEPKELSSYIRQFDVCINPQVSNQVTVGNYPRKIDEYLYMGKPTVATHTKAMEYFRDYVSLAHDDDGYIKAIEKELHDDNLNLQTKRKAFACKHTWEASVSILLTKLTTS